MKVREKGRLFQKGQFWSWKEVLARDFGGLEANGRLEIPQKTCWDENEEEQCDQKVLALMNDFVVLGLY